MAGMVMNLLPEGLRILTHLPHVAETVGLYILVKADVRSCEYLSTSANPDCGILDQGQGASQEHNDPTLCGSRNLLEDREFEASADTWPEFRLRLQGVHATSWASCGERRRSQRRR